MWKLFIDDLRFPVKENEFIIARSAEQAIALCEKMGCPQYISFDHDLGDKVASGFDFAKYLVEKDLDTGFIPDNFDYYIHSANPVGRENIDGLLQGYIKFKKKTKYGR